MDRFWFLTWTTYGTWLPGDGRGFVTELRDADWNKYLPNRPHTECPADLPGLKRFAEEALKGEPVWLVAAQADVLRAQLIGFNSQRGHIQSWNFSSDGGFAVGIWSPIENGWAAEVQSTRADGQTANATNLLSRLDDNAYAWKSIQRTIGGESLPDSDEVIYKRQTK